MTKKLSYERYHWFHGQIKAGRYPNARKLAEEFEISEKQAQREIEFMRDRLYAPLVMTLSGKAMNTKTIPMNCLLFGLMKMNFYRSASL